jgi:hypothetical protein
VFRKLRGPRTVPSKPRKAVGRFPLLDLPSQSQRQRDEPVCTYDKRRLRSQGPFFHGRPHVNDMYQVPIGRGRNGRGGTRRRARVPGGLHVGPSWRTLTTAFCEAEPFARQVDGSVDVSFFIKCGRESTAFGPSLAAAYFPDLRGGVRDERLSLPHR